MFIIPDPRKDAVQRLVRANLGYVIVCWHAQELSKCSFHAGVKILEMHASEQYP